MDTFCVYPVLLTQTGNLHKYYLTYRKKSSLVCTYLLLVMIIETEPVWEQEDLDMSKKNFKEYKTGALLAEQFAGKEAPLLLMQHLRQMDFPITRGISYERTVDDFLKQLAVNDVLRPLRTKQDLVVLLDREGALIREKGKWSLLFTPDRPEGQDIEEDAELLPVLEDILAREKKGEICRVDVPERSPKALVADMVPFCILDEYCKKQNGGYLAVAQRIVIAGPSELYAHVPVCHYGNLSTVDKDEIENYFTIQSLLDDYIYCYDHSEGTDMPRPLSIAIFGAPGSGKSFGVKQIANSCGRFCVSSLNLSMFHSPGELFEALHEALQRGKDEIPLVFFDEFDSEFNGVARGWLKYFLAPMQDGEYSLNGKTYQVNGAVFAFAGATAESFYGFLPSNEEEDVVFRMVKGTDFVSRLKGILNIKGPNPASETDRSHMIRRAMLLREQIVRKISGIYDPEGGLVNISRGVLSALLSVSEYRHGARSLEFILDMSRLTNTSRFTSSCLPPAQQLDIHLDVEDFNRKLAFEQIIGDAVETYAAGAHERTCRKRIEEAARRGADQQEMEALQAEPDMCCWEDLEECFRNSYRSQLRYIGERLQDYRTSIGIRPILAGDADTIHELYGPVLEELAEMEHERWMRDKRRDGWRFGPKDSEMKTTPELVPYAELDEFTKEFIRLSVRDFPEHLNMIGYELYRKSF